MVHVSLFSFLSCCPKPEQSHPPSLTHRGQTGIPRDREDMTANNTEWLGEAWHGLVVLWKDQGPENDHFQGGWGTSSLGSRAPAKGMPQDIGPNVPGRTEPLRESELAQGRQSQPLPAALHTLPAHVPPPRVSLGEAGKEETLNGRWPQRLLIKGSKWNGNFVFSIPQNSLKRKSHAARREAQMLETPAWKARWKKQSQCVQQENRAMLPSYTGEGIPCFSHLSPHPRT